MFSKLSIFLFSFFVFFAFQQISYSQNKFEIVPGKSIGTIKIGDCKDSVLLKIKSKYTEKTFQEEKAGFVDNDLSTLPQFVLGFDKAVVFDDFPVYQVFKVYFLKDSLNYIMLTSYGFGSEKTIAKYQTKKNIGFYDSPKKLIKVFGEPEKIVTLKDEVDYIYWSKGIEFVCEDDQIVVIYIFKPIVNIIK